jgi:hypothetical protein
MNAIPEFTESELWIVESTLKERYGRPVDVELAESEVRLDPLSTELTSCPAAVWTADGCHFVLLKTADRRYRAQFFYRVHQQFGTGIPEYDDISECVVTLLQVQADYAGQHPGDRSA